MDSSRLDYYTSMVHQRTQFGLFAEEYVRRYLQERGYRILDSNYRKPWGEIDIITTCKEIIIFVEVKASQGEYAGFEPELRVNQEKIKKLIRAARTYLLEKKYDTKQEWQIDVVAVIVNKRTMIVKFKHYKNIDVEF